MTGAQMRMVYMLCGQSGINNDELHDIVWGLMQKESLTALTSAEGIRLIDRLRKYCGDIPNRATQKQKWMIARLETELGWAGEPARLRGMVQRVAGVDDVKFCTIAQAGKIIEALKAMQRGGRGARKEEANELDGRSDDG